MIGLGFRPFHAAALNLIANTAPVAWGSVGIPIHTLAAVCGLPESDLSATIGRILPITAVIVPFWLVRTMVSWHETFEVFPAILVVGVSFALTQFFWSNYVDSSLVDIMGGVISIVATVAFLQVSGSRRKSGDSTTTTRQLPLHRPRQRSPTTFGGEWTARISPTRKQGKPMARAVRSYPFGTVLKAWMPFAILSVFVLVWGLPPVKLALNQATTPAFKVVLAGWQTCGPGRRAGTCPICTMRSIGPLRWWPSQLPKPRAMTSTGCQPPARVLFRRHCFGPAAWTFAEPAGEDFLATRCCACELAVIAISFMLGLGYVTRYSGLDAVLGLAFTRTGWAYPFFGTFLGWLGVALTGSDTSSNALFGSLQRITSQQLGIDPVLMCAANSAGGVMGKMVDAQSITIATAATDQVGNEGVIFRFVVWHSVALGAIVGVIVMLYAYVFPHLVPHGLDLREVNFA